MIHRLTSTPTGQWVRSRAISTGGATVGKSSVDEPEIKSGPRKGRFLRSIAPFSADKPFKDNNDAGIQFGLSPK